MDNIGGGDFYDFNGYDNDSNNYDSDKNDGNNKESYSNVSDDVDNNSNDDKQKTTQHLSPSTPKGAATNVTTVSSGAIPGDSENVQHRSLMQKGNGGEMGHRWEEGGGDLMARWEKGHRALPMVVTVGTADIASGYGSTSAGGTLTVTPETYTGEIAIETSSTYGAGVKITKALTIECSATDHSCILDGEDDHRVVFVYGVSSGTTNLIGLKITRGSIGNYGAGIYIRNSDATITNCLISDNEGSVSTRGYVHLNSLLFVRVR